MRRLPWTCLFLSSVWVLSGEAASNQSRSRKTNDKVAATDQAPENYRAYRNAQGHQVYEDENSQIVIVPQNLVEAPGPGDPSAESLRAQGFVFIDRASRDSLRRTGPCRYEVSYTDDDGKTKEASFEVGCLIDPQLKATVEPVHGGAIRYSYVIYNGAQAEHPLHSFRIDAPGTDVLLSKSDAGGWRLLAKSGRPLGLYSTSFGWGPSDGSSMLAPGKSISGLEVTSRYLPGLTEVRFRGFSRKYLQEHLPYSLEQATLAVRREERFIRSLTVGPMIPPPNGDPGAMTVVFDHLDGDVERALANGLIDDPGAAELRAVLDGARGQSSDAAALQAAARRVGEIRGIDGNYQGAVEVALRALAEQN